MFCYDRSEKDNLNLGFCFGTVLMRGVVGDVYFTSLFPQLSKSHFYMVSVGNEEDEENFWIKGRELLTLYTIPQGFRVLSNSSLEMELADKISAEDYSNFQNLFRSQRDLRKDYPFLQVRKLPSFYPSLDECIKALKFLGKEITIYSIQTKTKPYYLEEIRHF